MSGRALLVAIPLLSAGCTEYGLQNKPPAVDSLPTTAPAGSTPSTTTPPPDDGVPTVDDIPVALATMYAHTSDALFTLDPDTLDVVRIGPFTTPAGDPVGGMVDLAIDLDGRMFGGTDWRLYRIDPTTAVADPICALWSSTTALTFTSAGELFSATAGRIDALDPATCETTELTGGTGYETSGDLVGLPDGYLYWTVLSSWTSDALVRVDPDTGDSEWIGEVGGAELYGLGYDDDRDQLYGFSSFGRIVTIDPATASGAVVDDDSAAWAGATTNPVVWN